MEQQLGAGHAHVDGCAFGIKELAELLPIILELSTNEGTFASTDFNNSEGWLLVRIPTPASIDVPGPMATNTLVELHVYSLGHSSAILLPNVGSSQ